MEGISIDHNVIQQAVIEAATSQIVEHYRYEHDLSNQISAQAQAIIRERFDEVVAPTIAQGIDNLVIQPTNRYGEPKQDPMTLKEFIASAIDKHLTEFVTTDGQVFSDTYGRTGAIPRLEYIVKISCQKEIAEAVAVAAKSIKDQIGAVMGETVKKAIDERLAKLNYL